MAKKILNWLNETIANLAHGVKGKTSTLRFEPVMKKGQKCMAVRPCKCGYKFAPVARALENKNVYAIMCPKCKTVEYKVVNGSAPHTEVVDERCKGTNKNGSPCKNKPQDNGYCGRHQNQAPCYEGKGLAEKHLRQETRF